VLSVGGRDLWLANKRVLADHILAEEKYRDYIHNNSEDYKKFLKEPVDHHHQGEVDYSHVWVYCIYGSRMYVDYARYSIMSLRVGQPKAKIFVYVEEQLYWEAWRDLRPFIPEEDIICVHGKTTAYKHVVACDRALRKYLAVTFVDADLFFIIKNPLNCGALWNMDITMIHIFSEYPKRMMWAFARDEKPNVSHTFMHKRGREATRYKDSYTNDLEEVLDISVQDLIKTENIWYISYIFSFCPKALITPEYQAFVQHSQFTWNHCDESHWWLWGKKEKFENLSWNRLRDISVSSTTHKSDKNVHLFQPMFTDTLDTNTHRKEETLEVILNIEKQWKDILDKKQYRW